jgi:SAM-dependent methyltransferase
MSFGAIADDYDRLRPGPPEPAIEWLLPARCQVAVDVGAGTGLLTRGLAGKVARVVAVEPDARMRAVLRARSPGVEVLEGAGEAIPLPDASADGVFISSAWHWMDPERAVPEIARVLRDGGRFGVIGTRSKEVRLLRGLKLPENPAGGGRSEPGTRLEEVALPEGAPFANGATETFPFTRTMTIDTLLGLLGTYSGVITASPQDREAWLARISAELRQQFPDAGEIEVPIQTRCWRADRTARLPSGPGH